MTFLAYERTPQYGERPKPSATESAFTALGRPAIRSLYAVDSALDWAKGEPQDENLKNSVDLIDYKLTHPDIGTGQQIGNTVAGIAGMFLDPVGLAAGGILGKAVGKGAALATDLVPDYVSAITNGGLSRESISSLLSKPIPLFANNKFARYLPNSFHDILETEAEAAGTMAGFTLPESFLDNYNRDDNRLDYGGMARSIAFNGGLGLALPPVAWTGGVIFGKIAKATGKEVSEVANEFKGLTTNQKLSKLSDALEAGHISQDEHDWLSNYYTNPGDMDSHVKGSIKLLDKENHPVNLLSGDIELPFMTQDEAKQFQIFALDQMASQNSQDYKSALSEFVSHSMLDRMNTALKENPSMLDGIKAHIDAVESKLSKKVEQLEREDYYIEKTTTRKATRNHPISQQKLYKMMEGGDLSHREMPFIVPDNIKSIASQEKNIKMLELKSKNYEKEFNKTGRTKFKKLKDKNDAKVEQLKVTLEDYKKGEGKILSQAEELKAISDRLLPLPKNYHLSTDYLRLIDLAHVYPQARALMRKLAVREQYALQEAYKEVLKGIVQISESGMTQFAKPEKVVNYFKERIEGRADIKQFEEYMSDKVEDVKEAIKDITPESVEAKFNEINANPEISDEAKAEFNNAYERLNQFKNGNEALLNMVNCIMEAENVAI